MKGTNQEIRPGVGGELLQQRREHSVDLDDLADPVELGALFRRVMSLSRGSTCWRPAGLASSVWRCGHAACVTGL